MMRSGQKTQTHSVICEFNMWSTVTALIIYTQWKFIENTDSSAAGGALNRGSFSLSVNRVMFKPQCYTAVIQGASQYFFSCTIIWFYIILISWHEAQKRELLTLQGHHYFLVHPGVLRQHSQSPRQPRIQLPWCCPTATACCKETWVGGRGRERGWVGSRAEDRRKSPMKWSRQTSTHLSLQLAHLPRLQSTEPRL